MRFRRSTPVTSRVGATIKGPPRAMRLARLLRLTALMCFIAVVVMGLYFLNVSWVSADGIVVGDLGSIAPTAQGRITQLNKHCLDYVVKGDVVAKIEDETTAATAQQELAQFQLNAADSRADAVIAKSDAAAAQAYVNSLVPVTQQLQQVLKAEESLLKRNYVASLDYEQAKDAVAQAVANQSAAEYLVESKTGDGKKSTEEAALTDQRIAQFQSSPALFGTYYLKAPKSGYLTECAAVEGSVVNSGTSLFSIYDPSEAYTVAFFDPSDAIRLHIGDVMTMSVAGLKDKISGKVTAFYPEESALPDALTRYFWQDQKWSQYVPVRIDFTQLTATQQRSIYDSAEVSATVWRVPTTGFFGMLTHAFGTGSSS